MMDDRCCKIEYSLEKVGEFSLWLLKVTDKFNQCQLLFSHPHLVLSPLMSLVLKFDSNLKQFSVF